MNNQTKACLFSSILNKDEALLFAEPLGIDIKFQIMVDSNGNNKSFKLVF
jgi:hypothetical protein